MARLDFIKSGELDTPIELYYFTNTQNEYGEVTQTKNLLKTIWGKLMPKGGSEGVKDNTIVATTNVTFLVRYDTALNLDSTTISPEEYFTIKYLNKYWNISSMEYNGRGLGVLIKCYFTDNE